MSIKKLLKRKRKYSIVFLFFLNLILGTQLYAQNSQEITLEGKITDAAGLSLPGVNILEKGTKNGVSTDFEGTYKIKVSSSKAVLNISFIGFQTQEITVGGKTNINVSLVEDTNALKEVVVVGYGTVKKTDLTGSVGTLDAKAITEKNTTNVLEGIQGNVAGVQINASTGRLGDPFTIAIRGKSSFSGGATPLFVVDGVPTDGIDFLNPQDIARIDILKDASSTAIYGSRGTNGVVIVTTKSGSTAKAGMTVSIDSYIGGKQVARLPKMMSGQKWWLYHQSAYLTTAKKDPITGTVTPATLNATVIGTQNSLLAERVANNDTFDWYDAVLKDGIQQNNYVSISGRGDSGLAYNLGIGLQNETGNVENESLDKYSFKVGLTHKLNDKFTVGTNLTLTKTNQELGSALAMQEAFRLSPFYTPYDLHGNLFPLPGKLTDDSGAFLINKTSTYNPLLEIANSTNEIARWNGVGNVFVEYKPISWLTFKSTYAVGYDHARQGQAWGALTNTGVANRNLPSASVNEKGNFNSTWDNQFTINYDLNKDHSFTLLGLQSMYYDKTETTSASSTDQPFDLGFDNLGSGKQSTFLVGSSYLKSTLLSYALRLNYSYKGRYLLTLSDRWDGSSRFADNNKWGSFPSAAFAWRVVDESFMKTQQVVSDLKLRTSYGYTGNNKVAAYSTINKLDQQTYYDYNNTTANGWLQGKPANKELGWEKMREFNVGLDFGFLNNRITGSVDVYDRLSTDLLLDQKLVVENGYTNYTNNIGSVSNKGIEVLLTTKNINTDFVKWETTFVFSKNNNKIVSVYDKENDDVGNNLFIGESIDAIYNYKFTGIWQANQAAEAASYGQSEGQARVEDVNGDGKITTDDRQILGHANPDWTGSISTKLNVGNFDLSASAIISEGSYVFSPYHANFTNVFDRGRQKADIDWYIPANDAGLPANASNQYPMAFNEGTYWNSNGVGYYRDNSFVKIKNIALGYTFKPSVIEKFKMKYLRFYVNVLNPFVFTKYDGYDPEWAAAGFGVGRVASITYQMGMSVKF
ncbi:SusC/RagA family TonB-linked outer membrane protein [Flavobacterium sp. FlaQc-50]|uniref:SusC/RagA family TonB-linked outer membrane protein n=1 Tax=unclassified Flavobacterium TaxID=196869 RepID=UPI0037577062